MIEVGESTGALPADAEQRGRILRRRRDTRMTASISLIEPAIMIFMGIVRRVSY